MPRTDPPSFSRRPGCVGRRAERKAAERTGMRQVAGSGASPKSKGDLRHPGFLIECKATRKKSLPVRLHWLVKIAREALAAGRDPALMVQFLSDEEGNTQPGGRWVMLPEAVWLSLIEALRR